MSRGRPWLAIGALALASACGGGGGRREQVRVSFVVRAPLTGQDGDLDDRPLTAADRLVVWVERQGGERIDGSEYTSPLPATRLTLPTLPFAEDVVLRVDAREGDLLLARGRSFPFDVAREGVVRSPSLYLGTLGRFGRRTASTMPADPIAILPTPDGALIACADGTVHRFAPFDAQAPLAATAFTLDPGARTATVGDRLLAAFSPTTQSLVLIAPDGTIAATITAGPLARHGAGAMLVADDAGTQLLVIGGEDQAAGEDAAAVTRVDVPADPSAATATAIASLPTSRWAGVVVWVAGESAERARALVLGGESHGAVTSALLVDPRGAGASSSLPLALPLSGASAVALAGEQVLLVGGVGNDVRLLVVDTSDTPSITQASPSPPGLAVPRDAPRLVRYATSIVLVLGGTASGAPVRSAEIVDLRAFPGSTVQTGVLPPAVVAPHAALLRDESVWVFDRGGVFGYVPPRGQD